MQGPLDKSSRGTLPPRVCVGTREGKGCCLVDMMDPTRMLNFDELILHEWRDDNLLLWGSGGRQGIVLRGWYWYWDEEQQRSIVLKVLMDGWMKGHTKWRVGMLRVVVFVLFCIAGATGDMECKGRPWTCPWLPSQ